MAWVMPSLPADPGRGELSFHGNMKKGEKPCKLMTREENYTAHARRGQETKWQTPIVPRHFVPQTDLWHSFG